MLLPSFVSLLRPRFSGFKLPIIWLPYWILWFLSYFRLVALNLERHLASTCTLAILDNYMAMTLSSVSSGPALKTASNCAKLRH